MKKLQRYKEQFSGPYLVNALPINRIKLSTLLYELTETIGLHFHDVN
jgi:hypothetical protein